jgi:hypothetical protein
MFAQGAPIAHRSCPLVARRERCQRSALGLLIGEGILAEGFDSLSQEVQQECSLWVKRRQL